MNLRRAHLEQASLQGAHLEGAHLQRVHLWGANLHGVIGLTKIQLATAITDAETILPDYLEDEDE